MTTEPKKAGVHALFAPYVADTSDAGTKPTLTAVAAGVISFGRVEEAEIDPPALQDEEEIWVPDATTGQYVIADILEAGAKLTGALTLVDMSPLALSALWRPDGILATADTQFNPNAGSVMPRGWLRLDFVDHKGTTFKTLEIYVRLKLKSGLKFSKQLTKPVLEYTILQSNLNTGGLA